MRSSQGEAIRDFAYISIIKFPSSTPMFRLNQWGRRPFGTTLSVFVQRKKGLENSVLVMNNDSAILCSWKKESRRGNSVMVVEREVAAWSDDVFVLSALSLN